MRAPRPRVVVLQGPDFSISFRATLGFSTRRFGEFLGPGLVCAGEKGEFRGGEYFTKFYNWGSCIGKIILIKEKMQERFRILQKLL